MGFGSSSSFCSNGTQTPGGMGAAFTQAGKPGVTGGGGMELGLKTTVKGDTYTFKYESNESDCGKHTIPACPDADGDLNATGAKAKVGFSNTVTRGGRVLSKRSYAKSITVETRGKVADDAKLDHVDVKYSEKTTVVTDGLRYTSYGNRSTRINMRSGNYAPGESVSFGSAAEGGQLANTTGFEAALEAVKDCTPEWASALTGLPATTVMDTRLGANLDTQTVARRATKPCENRSSYSGP